MNQRIKRPWWRKWKRYYLRQYPNRRKLHGSFLHRLLGNRLFAPELWIPSRDSVAKGVAIGLFMGLMPLMGLQIGLSIVLCFAFRVNLSAAVLATFITNPVTGPGIILLQYKFGLWIAGPIDPEEINRYGGILRLLVGHGKPLIIGSLISGLLGALVGYLASLVLWDVIAGVGRKLPHPHLPLPPRRPQQEPGSPSKGKDEAPALQRPGNVEHRPAD